MPQTHTHHHTSIFVLLTCLVLFILLLTCHYAVFFFSFNPTTTAAAAANPSITHKLRLSVTFLPLKDLRFSHVPLQGHTWFMSSLYDTHQNGDVQFQQFPSPSSHDRLLCLMGRDTHDGARNSYALAWPDALPYNSTLLTGLTFVSYNHFNYHNIWHGLSAAFPFVAWYKMSNCSAGPMRWVLYHWGELRLGLGQWVRTLMEATFHGPVNVERFGIGDGGGPDGSDYGPVCFEEAVVMRHNEGGMWREKRMEVYDLMRCRARIYCGVGSNEDETRGLIGMTLFLRRGARSFKNESAVAEIFGRECAKVDGCRFMVAHSNNLTVCQQVKLMSMTDILISPHGAQLTNMFLMNRNSSVMEFFPKGWLRLAGVGQYVFHWLASWSGMVHQGAWRDPNGEPCPFGEDDRRCMTIFKGGRIGLNETHFAEWARSVLAQVKAQKMQEGSVKSTSPVCRCA